MILKVSHYLQQQYKYAVKQKKTYERRVTLPQHRTLSGGGYECFAAIRCHIAGDDDATETPRAPNSCGSAADGAED